MARTPLKILDIGCGKHKTPGAVGMDSNPRSDADVLHDRCATQPPEGAADLDVWLAAQCRPEVLARKPFTPLPVLGVPGWWSGNENFSFYEDSLVFRPRKTPEPTITTTSAGLTSRS